jgi:antitoxin (DNA-binding transcriptional repressor) of toxin-antitoxin stability system
VRTISIKQLHAETGRWVRAAKKTPLVVTDRGERFAELRPLSDTAANPPPFPRRDLSEMPRSLFDSTVFISEDRDRQ